jgi:branched-chain amino acid transport system permease protein
MLSMPILLQLIWSGLATASFSCLFAVAFALVLKVNHVWNFAQAAMIVVSYAAALLCSRELGWPIGAALAGAIVVGTCFSLLVERFGFAVLRGRRSPMLTFFIFALTLSELCIFSAEAVFGTTPTTLRDALVTPIHLIGGVAVSDWDVAALATTAILLALLAGFLRLTRHGQHLVAVADSPALAQLYGIDAASSFRLAMALAGVLVAAGTVLLGTKAATVPATALQQFLTVSVVATILAGIGRVFGAGLAALLLGVAQALSILFIAARWQPLLTDALMVIAVLVFPNGVTAGVAALFGQRRRTA